LHDSGNHCNIVGGYKEAAVNNSYDYIEGRLAEQRLAAEQRRRVAQVRSRRGNPDRFGAFLRTRLGRHGEITSSTD